MLAVVVGDTTRKSIGSSMAALANNDNGIAFILAMLFCLFDPSPVLLSSTGQPIVLLAYLATRSRASADLCPPYRQSARWINGVMGSQTYGSRLLYAIARDKRTMIFPSFFGRIHPRPDVPIKSIVFIQPFNLVCGLYRTWANGRLQHLSN